MIGYRRDESFFCNAPLDSARNTFLTKQTVESRKRFNRKNVGFQFVFLLVCMLLMNIRLACADDWVGFQLAENEHFMSYQDSGDILCSSLNQEGQLTSIKKLNYGGKVQWTHNFNEPYVQGTILFRASEDGTAFALCGKVKSTNQYEATLIGEDGFVQNMGILSSQYKPWAMIDTGILFSSSNHEDKGKNSIYYNGWDGKQSQGIFSGNVIDVRQSVMVDNSVFLSAIYERPDSPRIASVIGINLETGHTINYDIGEEKEWTIQTVGKSSDDNILVVAYNSDQHYQLIVQLTSSGELKWKTTLYSDLYYPVAQIIRQCGDDNYEIWGTAGVLSFQEEYPKLFTTYKIELGGNGELVDNMIGTYSGDCVEYKDAQIYVVDVDEFNYVSLDTFKADSRSSKSVFYTNAK